MSEVTLEGIAREYRAFKVRFPGRSSRIPQHIRDMAYDLYREGFLLKEIAGVCGVSPSAAHQWIRPFRPMLKQNGLADITVTIDGMEVKGKASEVRQLLGLMTR